jgi:hypothetical protein
MTDPRAIIAESRPMLEEFLGDIGILQPGQRICGVHLLRQFSDWVRAQEITENDVPYLAARVAAFICEYLIDGHSAERRIDGQRILLRLPIDTAKGVYKEFDPYAAAFRLVRDKGDLAQFVILLCDGTNA